MGKQFHWPLMQHIALYYMTYFFIASTFPEIHRLITLTHYYNKDLDQTLQRLLSDYIRNNMLSFIAQCYFYKNVLSFLYCINIMGQLNVMSE